MREAAVALTDYALTIENAVFAVLLWRARARVVGPLNSSGQSPVEGSVTARWFAMFFAAIALSSAVAGTFHGFLGDEGTAAGGVLWRAVMITVGMIAVAGANAAACVWRRPPLAVVVRIIAVAAFLYYCVVVLFVSRDYRNAIMIYMPAAVFLLVSFVVACIRERRGAVLAGAAGMLLTFVAAGVQQSDLQIASLGLEHNALYHVLQALALLLVYFGARACLRAGADAGSGATSSA